MAAAGGGWRRSGTLVPVACFLAGIYWRDPDPHFGAFPAQSKEKLSCLNACMQQQQ